MKLFKTLLLTVFITQVSALDIFELKSLEKIKGRDAHAKIMSMLAEVESLIPDSVKKVINKKVKIEFVAFPENKEIKELSKDRCVTPVKMIYGQVNTFSRDTIKIADLFIPEILKGESESTSFPCGHKNYYRKAMATIIHELGHVYDYKKVRTSKHNREVNECIDESSRKWKLGAKCSAIKSQYRNKKSVSGLHDFMKLANWSKGFLGKSNKNLSTTRSTDAYENENMEEHFAVNFEYFLLDENFKCHRPSYYKFFKDHFNFSPYKNSGCEINTKIILDDVKRITDLSPERVYRVDYLLASKGDGIISGFGHSMFRLIVCAPFRAEATADCENDTLYHVVLSYRANITDIKSNALKGLVGGYDSLLYLLSFPKVVEEYNQGELRDLMSLPIHLTKEQKTSFLHKVLEMYWEYAGDYKFLSNNCASESHELLQSALLENDIKYGSVVMPYSVMDEIIKNKLSKEGYFENEEEAVKKGFLFKSDEKRILEIKSNVLGDDEEDFFTYRRKIYNSNRVKIVKKKKDAIDIVKNISIERLRDKFEELSLDKEKNAQKISDLSILVQAFEKVFQKDFDDEVGTRLEKEEASGSKLGIKIKNWNDLRLQSRVFVTDNAYGIPLDIAQDDIDKFNENAAEMNAIEKIILEEFTRIYEKEVSKLEETRILIKRTRNLTKILRFNQYLQKGE